MTKTIFAFRFPFFCKTQESREEQFHIRLNVVEGKPLLVIGLTSLKAVAGTLRLRHNKSSTVSNKELYRIRLVDKDSRFYLLLRSKSVFSKALGDSLSMVPPTSRNPRTHHSGESPHCFVTNMPKSAKLDSSTPQFQHRSSQKIVCCVRAPSYSRHSRRSETFKTEKQAVCHGSASGAIARNYPAIPGQKCRVRTSRFTAQSTNLQRECTHGIRFSFKHPVHRSPH